MDKNPANEKGKGDYNCRKHKRRKTKRIVCYNLIMYGKRSLLFIKMSQDKIK